MPWVDTNDDVWIDTNDESYHQDQFGSVHTTISDSSSHTVPLQVECKLCGIKQPYEINRIGINFFLEPTDQLGVCTCYICYHKPKDPPKDIISTYHNRRKLRTRSR